jgi:hypothetical protein
MTLSIPDLDLPAAEDIDNIIFVRIPKTGSTSVMALKTKKWEELSGKHVDYRTWRGCQEMNKTTLSFTIVRNPFAMLWSQYQHRRRRDKVSGSFKEFIEAGCVNHNYKCDTKNIDLKTHPFYDNAGSAGQMMHLISTRNQVLFNQIKTQSLFYQIFDETGECKVNFILKLECIDSCIDFLNTYICNDIKSFPSKNVHFNPKDYKKHYTSEMIKLIENYYDNDLKMFGYNFDGSLGDDAIIDPKTVSIQAFDSDKLFKGDVDLRKR